jgi:hypothetical protein
MADDWDRGSIGVSVVLTEDDVYPNRKSFVPSFEKKTAGISLSDFATVEDKFRLEKIVHETTEPIRSTSISRFTEWVKSNPDEVRNLFYLLIEK